MNKLILIFFITLNQFAFGQLVLPENRIEIRIAKVSPTQVETLMLNKSTDEFEKVIENRQYSLIHGDSIDFSKIKNDTLLGNHDREAVLSILQRDKKDIESEVVECYIPRHIVSFFDQANNFIGAIEICFQCLQNKTYKISKQNELFLQPNQYKDLETIFKKYHLIE